MENAKFKELVSNYIDDIYVITPKIIMGLIVLALFILFGYIVKKIIKKIITNKAEDPLLSRFIEKLIFWITTIIGFTLSLKIMGFGYIAGGILAGAGIGAFVIGFAFKDIGENFLSGIMLAFSRPFRVGDTVESNGVLGKVISLDLRNTHLKSLDGKDIYIPNSIIVKNNLINYTIDGYIRHSIEIGIDYNSDIRNVIDIVNKGLLDIKILLNTPSKEPSVKIGNLSSSSLTLIIHYWIDTFDNNSNLAEVKKEIVITILDLLNKANISMPGDIIELKNYGNGLKLIK